MKIKAVQTVIFNGTRVRPGQVADLPDAEAQVLIAQGFAVAAPQAAEPAPAGKPAGRRKGDG